MYVYTIYIYIYTCIHTYIIMACVRSPWYDPFIKYVIPVFLPGTFRESFRTLVVSMNLHK